MQMHCVYTRNPHPNPIPYRDPNPSTHDRHSEDHQRVLPPSLPASWPELVSISSSSDERCISSAETMVATAEAMVEEAEAKAEETRCGREIGGGAGAKVVTRL